MYSKLLDSARSKYLKNSFVDLWNPVWQFKCNLFPEGKVWDYPDGVV